MWHIVVVVIIVILVEKYPVSDFHNAWMALDQNQNAIKDGIIYDTNHLDRFVANISYSNIYPMADLVL